MRTALKEVRDEAKMEGADKGYLANAATAKTTTAAAARDEARDEIAGQMRDSFSAVAASAVAKSDTLDANAATIASLTKTIVELTATNKKLVTALAAANRGRGTPAPPPGFSPDANLTGHNLNSLGDSCPTKKWKPGGRWQFITKQFCKTCNNMVNYIPTDCPELPGNESIKAEMQQLRARKQKQRRRKKTESGDQ